MAYSLQIVTESGAPLYSLTYLLPPIDPSITGLLQAFYMSGKESGGYQAKSLQTQGCNIVFEEFTFGSAGYIFILAINKSLPNSGFGYFHITKALAFLQVALVNLTGPQLWTSEDPSQIEVLKKELKGYNGFVNEVLKAIETVASQSVATPVWITKADTIKKFLTQATFKVKSGNVALWFEGSLLASTGLFDNLNEYDKRTVFFAVKAQLKECPFFCYASNPEQPVKHKLKIIRLGMGYTLTILQELSSENVETSKWLNEQISGLHWNLAYPKEAIDQEWIYVNQKGKYECWSKGVNTEITNLLNKYALATVNTEHESTEVSEAFYKYEKGLVFVITSEFSTIALHFRGSSDPKIAQEKAYEVLQALEDYLKAYTPSIQ